MRFTAGNLNKYNGTAVLTPGGTLNFAQDNAGWWHAGYHPLNPLIPADVLHDADAETVCKWANDRLGGAGVTNG